MTNASADNKEPIELDYFVLFVEVRGGFKNNKFPSPSGDTTERDRACGESNQLGNAAEKFRVHRSS